MGLQIARGISKHPCTRWWVYIMEERKGQGTPCGPHLPGGLKHSWHWPMYSFGSPNAHLFGRPCAQLPKTTSHTPCSAARLYTDGRPVTQPAPLRPSRTEWPSLPTRRVRYTTDSEAPRREAARAIRIFRSVHHQGDEVAKVRAVATLRIRFETHA